MINRLQKILPPKMPFFVCQKVKIQQILSKFVKN